MDVYRACLGCGEPTPGPRCPDCQADVDQRRDDQRGNAHQRGYGRAHQNQRARWTRKVATGDITCWRCGRLITPDQPWDLGHDDNDRNQYNGPEHLRCNRATAGARA